MLEDLEGKKFRYISKHGKGKMSNWIGIIESTIVLCEGVGPDSKCYRPVIKFISKTGSVYDPEEVAIIN